MPLAKFLLIHVLPVERLRHRHLLASAFRNPDSRGPKSMLTFHFLNQVRKLQALIQEHDYFVGPFPILSRLLINGLLGS